MRVGFHKGFEKQYAALSSGHQARAKEALALFRQEPLHPALRNHQLQGRLSMYRSISAGDDLRLHYRIIDADTALFVAIGTHSQLYR